MTTTQNLRSNRRYVRYRTARAVSMLGSQFSWVTYPLLVLSLGGTPSRAGAVASCALVTRAVFRLPGGYIADRFDRRLLMLGSDAVSFVAVGTIPLAAAFHLIAYPQLLVVATLEGVAIAIFGPSATGILRDLVPADLLKPALGQSQAFNAVITLAGPILGGVLYGLNRMLPFTLDAFSYGMSAVLLLGLAVARKLPEQDANSDSGVLAGLRWLWHRPGVMRVLIFIGTTNLVGSAIAVTVVVGLHERGAPPTAIGVVMACSGAGSVLGAIFAARLEERLGPARLCLAMGSLWSLGFASIAASPSGWVIGPVLVLLFLCVPVAGVMLGTLALGEAPHHLLGRVSTAEQVVTTTPGTAGPLLAGACLQSFGVVSTWLVLTCLCVLATTFVVISALPRHRRSIGSPARVAADPLPSESEKGRVP
ncbi:MAG TPA: MFS transporter [Streptosporangiaceae bacterium]|nr:MFS transporter [Streptosporangiaceae bacterium]